VRPTMPDPKTLYCAFCGKSQHEVRKLIAGPTVFICDECVQLCADVCSSEIAQDTEEEAKTRAAGWLRRTTALRRAIDALSSTEADAIQRAKQADVVRPRHPSRRQCLLACHDATAKIGAHRNLRCLTDANLPALAFCREHAAKKPS
jgi:hypothetical protein